MSRSVIENCPPESLKAAADSADSMADALKNLGLRPTSRNYRLISLRLHQLGISTEHFKRTWRRKHTKETLEPIVQQCFSYSAVMRELGLPPSGGNHRFIQATLRRLEISVDHFTGAAWSRGWTAENHEALARAGRKNGRSDSEVFVENGPIVSGTKLVRRLLRLGWHYHCADCGINEWKGKPLRLHLDHINGISNDHRLENLRLVCPNCHSQTDTYCGRNKGRKQGPVAERQTQGA